MLFSIFTAEKKTNKQTNKQTKQSVRFRNAKNQLLQTRNTNINYQLYTTKMY